MNSYWDTEEFEDRVAKGIIALYEDKIPKKFRFSNPLRKVYPADVSQIRRFGLLFMPTDRISLTSEVVDSLSSVGCYTANKEREITEDEAIASNTDVVNGYVDHIFFRKIHHVRSDFFPVSTTGSAYEIFTYHPFHNDGLLVVKGYAFIKSDGSVVPLRERNIKEYPEPKEVRKDEDRNAMLLSVAHGFWSDRKYLWNVAAIEHEAKVLFGVYPEQIKSLFYARSLPLSTTGRKRPILHWVAAHKRRLKNGIDINIEKYLRGTEDFTMDGTTFRITQPVKQPKVKIKREEL